MTQRLNPYLSFGTDAVEADLLVRAQLDLDAG